MTEDRPVTVKCYLCERVMDDTPEMRAAHVRAHGRGEYTCPDCHATTGRWVGCQQRQCRRCGRKWAVV